MRHVNAENLMECMDGQATSKFTAEMEGHLSQCSDCFQLKQELEQFVLQLEADSSFEPVAELVQWGAGLFPAMLQPEESPPPDLPHGAGADKDSSGS